MIDGMPTQVIRPADEVVAGLELTPIDVRGLLNAAIADHRQGVSTWSPRAYAAGASPCRSGRARDGVRHPSHRRRRLVARPLARATSWPRTGPGRGHAPSWQPLPGSSTPTHAAAGRASLAVRDDDEGYRNATGRWPTGSTVWRGARASRPPSDRPRPAVPTFGGARVGFEIPPPARQRSRRHRSRATMTLFMVTHAALAILLTRLSGRNDVVIGTLLRALRCPPSTTSWNVRQHAGFCTEIDQTEPFSGLHRTGP